MTLVIDASVVLKWLFADPEREDYTELATSLMSSVIHNKVSAIQPIHWLIEVAAVISREAADRAQKDVVLLEALHLPNQMDPAILERACTLAIDLQHHLFDTLYHAVALENDAILVTADDRYHRKAKELPGIMHLKDWALPE